MNDSHTDDQAESILMPGQLFRDRKLRLNDRKQFDNSSTTVSQALHGMVTNSNYTMPYIYFYFSKKTSSLISLVVRCITLILFSLSCPIMVTPTPFFKAMLH